MEALLYVAVCVLLPFLWGWAAHRVCKRLGVERWFPVAPAHREPTAKPPTDAWDYSI